jgi:Rrf2 family protein
MISQTAEYALRAIVYLAAEPDAPKTTKQIAEATHVPVGYLSKVLQSLSRAGLISSQRGLYGGSQLLKSPEELSIYEIVHAVEPIQRIRSCPLGLKAHGTRLCPLHRRLDEAMALVEQSFRTTTVAEILAEPSGSRPLCEIPLSAPTRTPA